MSSGITIRPARADEMPLVLSFIRELAVYEHLEHEVVATAEDLAAALSGPRPYAEVAFACVDGTPLGFALFFHNFSTFKGKPGIYLEDLFVRPEARGRGLGKRLLAWLARTALERGCARLDWAVLDWNEPSIGFYLGLSAQRMDEWTTFRLTGTALEQLAREC
ncbi:MAG TPA: GNAT family N-acetyltransferase [Steroidobacteraceae bacterium]|jgi:GNAT superfamily N-acetyltransferase